MNIVTHLVGPVSISEIHLCTCVETLVFSYEMPMRITITTIIIIIVILLFHDKGQVSPHIYWARLHVFTVT